MSVKDPLNDELTLVNDQLAQQEVRLRTRDHYIALLPHSLLCAVVCFVSCLIAVVSYGACVLLLYLVFTILPAMIVLAAQWSVWGPGEYHERLCWSNLILLGPISFALTFWLVVSFLVTEAGFSAGAQTICFLAAGVPVVSWSAQLPFWLVRYWTGCQVRFGDSPPRGAATIRDVMVFMCLSGLAFGAPQLATDFMTSTALRTSRLAVSKDQMIPLESTGESNPVFDERIHYLKQSYLLSLQYSYFTLAVFFSLLSASSLLFIHSVFLAFASKDEGAGRRAAWGLLILFFAFPLTTILLAMLFFGFRENSSFSEFAFFVFIFIAWGIFLLAYLPALIAGIIAGTRRGFRLA